MCSHAGIHGYNWPVVCSSHMHPRVYYDHSVHSRQTVVLTECTISNTVEAT